VVAVQSLTAATTAINVPAMDSPALGNALANATRDWASADRGDRIIAHYFLFTYFKLVEQAWFQHKAKVLDEAQWSGWENGARLFYHSPGVKNFWLPHRRSAYAAEFQAHLAASAAPAAGMSSMSDTPSHRRAPTWRTFERIERTAMADVSSPLKALSLIAAGDWDGAHALVQDDASAAAAWVHAHLHRVEGDLDNATYWYRKAGKPRATGDLAEERHAIEAALRGA
jgi:hypothetical protein